MAEADLTQGATLTAGVEYQSFDNHSASRGGIPLFFTDGTQTSFARSTNTGSRWSDFHRDSVNAFASLAYRFNPDWRLQVDFEHKNGSHDETIGYLWTQYIDRQTGEGGSLLTARWSSDLKLDAVYASLQGAFELLGQTHQLALTYSRARYEDNGPGYPGWWQEGDYWRPVNAYDFYATGDAVVAPLEPTGERSGDRIDTQALSAALRLRPVRPLSIIIGGRVTDWKQSSLYLDAGGGGG